MDTGIKPLKENYKIAAERLQLIFLQVIIQVFYEE